MRSLLFDKANETGGRFVRGQVCRVCGDAAGRPEGQGSTVPSGGAQRGTMNKKANKGNVQYIEIIMKYYLTNM